MQKTLSLLRCTFLSQLRSKYLFFLGSFSILGFAPYKLFPITMVCYILLFRSKTKFSGNLNFFLGQTAFGCYWLFNSLTSFGHIPAIYSLILTAIAIFLIAVIPAILSELLIEKYNIISWPSMITISEIIRSYFLFSGFPWLLLGYTQIHSPHYKLIMLFGTHATTWITAFICVCVSKIYDNDKKYMAFIVIWLLFPLLVRAPISRDLEINYHAFAPNNPEYINILELPKNNTKSDIVLWPEGILHHPLSEDEITTLKKLNRKHLIIFGGIFEKNSNYYNSIIAVKPNGEISYHLKHNLVAFGEYWPWRKLISNFYHIPIDFKKAKPNDVSLIRFKNLKILPILCYDIGFPQWMSKIAKEADLLVSLHQMRWFNSKQALYQQLEMAQARSIEFGKSQIFVEPSIKSVLILANGKIEF